MATAAETWTAERGIAPAVRRCYDLLEVARVCGITDLTDGKYVDDRNDRTDYLAAQVRQAQFLLDQARCGAGSRLLDIGCGYGRILEHASWRGAAAKGVTISPPQVADCRARGLDVLELDYREIPRRGGVSWGHEFDAVVANGSLEHFVQPADAAAGHADVIYEEMFAICRWLLKLGGRLVTTAIHFRRAQQFDAATIQLGPRAQPTGSDAYQFAMLSTWFGGWYPEPGQLERCAAGRFELIYEEDGTHDYHLTSEYWLREFVCRLTFDPRVWWAVAGQIWQRPRPALAMLRLQLWDQSWAWQFRPPAPMQLLRQTWLAK